LAALHELAVAASGVLEPTALAKFAVDLACDLLGADGAALYWWTASTGRLHALADNRSYQEPVARSLGPGKGVAGLAFQRVEPVIIDDYPSWEGAVPWALANGVRAAVGTKLRLGPVHATLTPTTRGARGLIVQSPATHQRCQLGGVQRAAPPWPAPAAGLLYPALHACGVHQSELHFPSKFLGQQGHCLALAPVVPLANCRQIVFVTL